jgi:geranylgeranyl pyrophosphate synthase
MENQHLLSDFIAEIDEVQSTLLAATADLTSPLGDLVRAQIRRSQPPICGAVVLAVAQPAVDAGAPAAEDGSRRKRIVLAAALEMLHVALNVHRLLVNAALREQQSAGEISLDPSFIGSTILAGDYCFSRAAQMAAQTDHARVVAIFALTLQTVSEGLLREQFARGNEQTNAQNPGTQNNDRADNETSDGNYNNRYNHTNYSDIGYRDIEYDETRQLLHSGAYAAALLVDLPESQQQQAIAMSQEVATQWALGMHSTDTDEHQSLNHQEESLPQGWRALYQWLNLQRANGKISAIPPTRIH